MRKYTPLTIFVGNNQKKANALVEASGLKMIGVDDFDKAAKTVSDLTDGLAFGLYFCPYVGGECIQDC